MNNTLTTFYIIYFNYTDFCEMLLQKETEKEKGSLQIVILFSGRGLIYFLLKIQLLLIGKVR